MICSPTFPILPALVTKLWVASLTAVSANTPAQSSLALIGEFLFADLAMQHNQQDLVGVIFIITVYNSLLAYVYLPPHPVPLCACLRYV